MPASELNGDLRLSFAQRLRYLAGNFLGNCSTRSHSLRPVRYIPSSLSDDVLPASPSRACTETFIRRQLPQFLAVDSISVLDVGCGSGRFSRLLASIGYSGTYVGIDVDNRFEDNTAAADGFSRTFHKVDAHKFHPKDGFDLILSVSALEHIYDDALLINSFTSMLTLNGIQLHAVPGPWALPVYLWHGYRQYNLRGIEQRFGTDNVRVFSIGGMV